MQENFSLLGERSKSFLRAKNAEGISIGARAETPGLCSDKRRRRFFTRPVSATSTIPSCTRTQTIIKCQYQSDNQRCSLLVYLCSQSILLLFLSSAFPHPISQRSTTCTVLYYKLRYTPRESTLPSPLLFLAQLSNNNPPPMGWKKEEEGGRVATPIPPFLPRSAICTPPPSSPQEKRGIEDP